MDDLPDTYYPDPDTDYPDPDTDYPDPAMDESSSSPTVFFPGFQIVMDNLNINQKVKHKTSENKNKCHNLTHSMAVQDRICSEHLEKKVPQGDILTVPNEAFLPSEQDHSELREDFKCLIQRCLVEHLTCFKDFKDLVVDHIPHVHSKESARKSTIIPLGILEKDENITEQMISIMEHLQQYVPKDERSRLMPILLGGDALSVERGLSAQRARADAPTAEDRLQGLQWKSEDWHAHVTALQDTYNTFYSTKSCSEKGTMYQLRNQFDRRGVKKEVKDDVKDCREFLRFLTKGYILLAAMDKLCIETVDSDYQFVLGSGEERLAFFNEFAYGIIDTHIATVINGEEFLMDRRTNSDLMEPVVRRVKCGYPGCKKDFAIDGKCRAKHREKCLYKNVLLNEDEGDIHVEETCIPVIETSSEDHKYNYVCGLFRDGLLDWDRDDAAKENDGDRLIRLWRFDLLQFYQNNHTKYSLLAVRLLSQLMATLPPKMAYQLRYNRGINVHGGLGKNVPADQGLEFLNMIAKDSLRVLHGNLTSKSIERAGKTLKSCDVILEQYNKSLQMYFGKPSNTQPKIHNDLSIMVTDLRKEELFQNKPGRCFQSFPGFSRDKYNSLNGCKFAAWLTAKKEDLAKAQRLSSYD